MRIVSLSIGLVLAIWLATRPATPNLGYARGALALELDCVGSSGMSSRSR